MRNNLSEIYRYLGTRPQKCSPAPSLGRKSLKYIGFDECQIRPIRLLEASVYYVYVVFNNITDYTIITITSRTNRTVGEH
jgi:hypothetical protein